MLNLLLGQIPEAIYFALFMIYTKQLKKKRLLFVILMIIEYVLLIQIFPFNIWFQVLYTFMTYLTLKVIYKEKSQIIDIFTFSIASVLLMITSAIMYFISYFTYYNTYLCTFLHRIILFLFIFIIKNKLYTIQKLYKKIWNRSFNKKYKIKTTTFRAINVVVFNVMFFVINFGMLLCILIKNGGGNYRSQEYVMMLEEVVDDGMELARAYEDVSEMATESSEKQKLMKMAEREKEHYRTAKEMLEKHM